METIRSNSCGTKILSTAKPEILFNVCVQERLPGTFGGEPGSRGRWTGAALPGPASYGHLSGTLLPPQIKYHTTSYDERGGGRGY